MTTSNGTAPDRPTALQVNPDGIPAELKSLDQWVLWRYELRADKKGKVQWTKPPYAVQHGQPASSTDPKTWATFDDALAAFRSGGWDGIGCIHLPENNLAGLDVDKCRDPVTGELTPQAAAIVTEVNSYTEVSPSGTGIRAFAFGRKPDRLRSRRGKVEMYDGLTAKGEPGGRYLTLTGFRLPGSPATINDRQAAVEAIYRRELLGEKPERNGATMRMQPRRTGKDLTDDQLLAKARQATNGAKFKKLFDDGDTSLHNDDPSAADQALCTMLAWWAGDDAARIDKLFRRSKLCREKWTGRADYSDVTISKAIAWCNGSFWSSDGPPAPETEAKAAGCLSGYDLILAYFRSYYAPVFRRGTALYSGALGREVRLGEACCGAPIKLIEQLASASDAPHAKGAGVDRAALPYFFNAWCKSAWVDLLNALPEEEESAEVTELAEEEFRQRVAAALLHIVALGFRHKEKEKPHEKAELEVERRPLIDWCRLFAKDSWADVRGYRLWARKQDECLRVAFGHGFFGQLPGFADLTKLGKKKITQLCEKYAVGEPEKVQGGNTRVIELAPEFVAELLAGPGTDRQTGEKCHTHVREGDVSFCPSEGENP